MVEEEERQDHETLRLLYVALTRAQERLFVLGGRKGNKTSLAHRLVLAGAWPVDGCEPALIQLDGAAPIRGALAPVVEQLLPQRPFVSKDGPALLSAPQMKTLWSARGDRLTEALKSSWVRRPTDAVEASKESGWDEGMSSVASGLGPLVGRLCHSVLERWDFSGDGDLSRAVQRVLPALSRLDPAANWTAAAAEAEDVLRGFLSSSTARTLASAEILGREVSFIYAQDGAVVRGAIDLLYRQDGRLVVADYKTEDATKKELPKLRAKYEAQGRAYVEAVKKALGEKAEFRLIFLRYPEEN
jgi:ATP-dependent exoDNAse (exonuclease V) beta subunit